MTNLQTVGPIVHIEDYSMLRGDMSVYPWQKGDIITCPCCDETCIEEYKYRPNVEFDLLHRVMVTHSYHCLDERCDYRWIK